MLDGGAGDVGPGVEHGVEGVALEGVALREHQDVQGGVGAQDAQAASGASG